jgi:hypothetical protein
MSSRVRNLAEYSSWETGGGDYWRSPSTTRHILFDDFLERLRQTVLLIGRFQSKSANIVMTLKKKTFINVGESQLPGATRLPKLFQVLGHREIALAAVALHTYTSATIPITPCPETSTNPVMVQYTRPKRVIFCKPREKCIHNGCHKIGALPCVHTSESYSSFVTIVGTSTTAGPSTSASMTP